MVQGVTDYAIYMPSEQGDVTSWNAGAERIKGYRAEEVVGTHFSRFYIESDRDSGVPMAALETAAQEGRFESEGWRVRKDGSRFWAHAVVDPIRDQRGSLVGFAKVSRDVTEKREATLALERAKEQLFQAQKIDALGKLTAGVAHDFSNLLGVIVASAAILPKEALSESGSRVLDTLKRAAASGAALTQELLLFARQQPLQKEQQDMNS